YIVGEVWGDSREWLDGTQFDGVMNYLFTAPTIAFTAGDRVVMEQVQDRSYQPYPPLFAVEYGNKIQELLDLYPWEIQLTQLNLLASHDTARLVTIAGGDHASVELATLLLLTFPGAPSIYYGDEVGLPGAIDPDSRRGFPIEAQWNREILGCHRQLIRLRHTYPALRTGSYQLLFAAGGVYVFARILGAEELIVAVNVGTEASTINFSPQEAQLKSQPSKLLYGSAQTQWSGEGKSSQLTLELPSRTGCILGPHH
ncbi:MAG TPA: alpha-amylase family glycosyl hydrolase, partial [Candidatus Caenarcaniphilales bacterium]